MQKFRFAVLALALTAASVSLSTAALAKVEAQQKKNATAADFAGTWNIEMMSHQIALVIEPAEGNTVTGTMMLMGNDQPLKGEVVDGTLSLTGVKIAMRGEHQDSGNAAADHVAPSAPPSGPKPTPIVVTLQEDGTIAGEMMTNQGPVKWTGEKLRAKKKGEK